MPGGVVCSVATCKSNSKKTKETGENLMFFTFPNELKIRKEWMTKCCRKGKWNANYKRICSRHFKSDDFQDELQARLLGLQAKKLKKNAIPSLCLPGNEKNDITIERTKRVLNKERKAIVESFMHIDTNTLLAVPEKMIDDHISEIPSSSKETDLDILQRKFVELQQAFDALHQENILLKRQIADHAMIEEGLRQQIKEEEGRFDIIVKMEPI